MDCERALVKEFQEHGVIGYSPPSELERCDCCLYPAEDLDSEDGDQLCASCKAVFCTAQVLSTSDVTDEAEIISLYDPGFTHATRLRFQARLLRGGVSEMELLLI